MGKWQNEKKKTQKQLCLLLVKTAETERGGGGTGLGTRKEMGERREKGTKPWSPHSPLRTTRPVTGSVVTRPGLATRPPTGPRCGEVAAVCVCSWGRPRRGRARRPARAVSGELVCLHLLPSLLCREAPRVTASPLVSVVSFLRDARLRSPFALCLSGLNQRPCGAGADQPASLGRRGRNGTGEHAFSGFLLSLEVSPFCRVSVAIRHQVAN